MAALIRKQAVFAAIIVLAVLGLFEGAARLAEAILAPEPQAVGRGWQAEFFGSLFDWHEPDPDVLWRFKAGLDNPLIKTGADHLLGGDLPRPKPPRTYRLLLLGDSSPVGLGLASRRQAFGEIARYLLDRQFAGQKTAELINAAVPGYTSEQIVRWLAERGWDYRPDIVVLYCGNNDASISGTVTDRELLEHQKLGRMRTGLSHLALYRVMRAAFLGLAREPAAPPGESVAGLKVRVPPEQYENNLRNIADLCRRHRTPLIILKPPVPYLWPAGLQFKPFLHMTDRDGDVILPPTMIGILGRDLAYCLDRERFKELYGKIKRCSIICVYFNAGDHKGISWCIGKRSNRFGYS